MTEPPDELKQKIDEADIVKDVDVVLPTIIWSHRTGKGHALCICLCIMFVMIFIVLFDKRRCLDGRTSR